jgi:hypothetical protein
MNPATRLVIGRLTSVNAFWRGLSGRHHLTVGSHCAFGGAGWQVRCLAPPGCPDELAASLTVAHAAAWLGIVIPYHPRSLRWRWQHRRAWRTHLRWAVLAFAPFFYVSLIAIAILTPGVELARSLKQPGLRLAPSQFGISAAIVCATAIAVAALGPWLPRRLLTWRTTHLASYLDSTEKRYNFRLTRSDWHTSPRISASRRPRTTNTDLAAAPPDRGPTAPCGEPAGGGTIQVPGS